MARLNDQIEIMEACMDIMEDLVNDFVAYIERVGIDIPAQEGEDKFEVSLKARDIMKKLFLSGEGNDLEQKSLYLSHILDINKHDFVTVDFEGVKYHGCSQD